MKIVTILGARPQFIKAGTVSRAIMEHNRKVEGEKLEVESIEEIIVHTGQHFDANMSDIFFKEMKIPKSDYNLNINGLGHGAMTGQMLEKIEEVLLKEEPDWVMVYGDTNSTLAGALAASKQHIKVAHVEAGLRSFNMNMPEEVNRILTDRVSNILFCPTKTAVENLKNEGFDNFDIKVVNSGDVMQDGAMFYRSLVKKPSCEIEEKYLLCTVHRAENTDDEVRLTDIFKALNEIGEEVQIVLPLHPRTKKIMENLKINIQNLTIIEPVGYLEMFYLIKNAQLIMTDSGGLQKEAYFFKKPCITLRDETEWVELVEHNFNILAGADRKKIVDSYQDHSFSGDFDIELYGGGKASSKIVKALINA